MKGTRHSEEQIIAILKQGEAGLATADLCRQHGISRADLLSLEGQVRRHGERRSEAAEATGGGEPEAEARGSRADAGQSSAEGRADKKLLAPAGLRAAASYVMGQYSMSERHACRLMELGAIDASLSIMPSRARCGITSAVEGVGRAAHAVRLSALDGDAGAGRNSRRITSVSTGCIARKDWPCAFGSAGGSAGVGRRAACGEATRMSGGRWTLSVIASVAGEWFGC